jgi:hypothetical protein
LVWAHSPTSVLRIGRDGNQIGILVTRKNASSPLGLCARDIVVVMTAMEVSVLPLELLVKSLMRGGRFTDAG